MIFIEGSMGWICLKYKKLISLFLRLSNASIIGPIKIGDNAKIGAGAIVVDNVSPNSTYTGFKAKTR